MVPDALKDEILAATLPNIPFDGWSSQSLRDGARAAGHDTAAIQQAFPRGIPDVIAHFSTWADRVMLERLDGQDMSGLRVTDRVALAVRTRLALLDAHRDAVRRALAFLALPPNAGLGLTLLYRTVDSIWYAAGDSSTDFNYYTKRALLAGVHAATVLYWLGDDSADGRDTAAFLDRRLRDVVAIGRSVGNIGRAGRLSVALPSPLRFARQFRSRLRSG